MSRAVCLKQNATQHFHNMALRHDSVDRLIWLGNSHRSGICQPRQKSCFSLTPGRACIWGSEFDPVSDRSRIFRSGPPVAETIVFCDSVKRPSKAQRGLLLSTQTCFWNTLNLLCFPKWNLSRFQRNRVESRIKSSDNLRGTGRAGNLLDASCVELIMHWWQAIV